MTCYVGDVRDGLRQFIAQGVRAQTCITSPPYWGLRDYGTSEWQGGDADCEHVGSIKRTVSGGDGKQYTNEGSNRVFSGDCACGAIRIDRQLGLEPTIAEYVATMVEVFRLVRDVLADDGTLWLNLGDSYASPCTGYNPTAPSNIARQNGEWLGAFHAASTERLAARDRTKRMSPGLKPKDLCGIPWRVAFALQADGWYLRSDIIWAKPNPMPESVTDRPTKAHEYLFLLAKSERYYYDAAAIAEVSIDSASGNYERKPATARGCPLDGVAGSVPWQGQTRNRRTVWTIATEPYPDAHFAVMPTALVEPCIAAGSRVGDIILDPFMGSGTVAQVAQSLGRRWIGCELNPTYAKMIERRTAQQAMVLT